jgi:MtN3 and saliva related transmembrane protein
VAEYIGFLAAFLTTASFVPQAVKILRTRQTEGISLIMYAMFTAGIVAWLAYGIMTNSMPVIMANIITLMLASVILALKIQGVVQARKPSSAATAAL